MITRFIQTLTALRNDRRGVTIIEYAMLAALIGVGLVASLGTLKTNIAAAFTTIGTSL